ncbi:MAG: biotin--[acetyl-CoA-carboxylase] ligase [Spirochaetales bacterium]|nr:biotin--[acetyl-CoA-carboxylase] ligase [Spirochaetales bacterium]
MRTDKLEDYLRKDFKNPFPKAHLYYIEKTDSTMLDALDLIKELKNRNMENTISGTVIMAGYQETGRGRISGRKWNSKEGKNLLFTMIFSKDILKFPLLRLPLFSGVVLSRVIEETLQISVKIKWPNDLIYMGDKKLAGIICEAHGDYVLVGIGLNCNEDFNVNLKKYRPVSLKDILNREVNLVKLLKEILCKFRLYLEEKDSDRAGWEDELNSRLLGKNRRVKYRVGIKENYEGPAVLKGLDSEGALLLEKKNGDIIRLVSGEIELP